jgi:hypothetical protein
VGFGGSWWVSVGFGGSIGKTFPHNQFAKSLTGYVWLTLVMFGYVRLFGVAPGWCKIGALLVQPNRAESTNASSPFTSTVPFPPCSLGVFALCVEVGGDEKNPKSIYFVRFRSEKIGFDLPAHPNQEILSAQIKENDFHDFFQHPDDRSFWSLKVTKSHPKSFPLLGAVVVQLQPNQTKPDQTGVNRSKS